MKKKIAILGSTGSIGISTLEVIKKDKKNFDVILLSANNNYKKLIQQAKEFNVKNVMINDELHESTLSLLSVICCLHGGAFCPSMHMYILLVFKTIKCKTMN